MSSVAHVPPEDFVWGAESGPARVVDSVRRTCREADHHDPLDEASTLRLKNHGLDGSALWLAGDQGFALRHGATVDLAVAPDARGHGLGTDLAASALSGDDAVAAWSHGDHPAAARLAAVQGLKRTRELWVMRRSASLPLPEAPIPAGIDLRGFIPGDAPEMIRVNAAAFARHSEQGAMDAANLAERMAEPWFDPEGLLVAMGGPTMLGFHWTKRHSPDLGPELGEVYVVGIDPDAQGRGLGKLLTLSGLHHLADSGVSTVLLYVESDNAPAIALYAGLGFAHLAEDTHVQYRRGA